MTLTETDKQQLKEIVEENKAGRGAKRLSTVDAETMWRKAENDGHVLRKSTQYRRKNSIMHLADGDEPICDTTLKDEFHWVEMDITAAKQSGWEFCSFCANSVWQDKHE